MAGSAADTPTTPEFLRVSDVDRDRAVDELKQEYVDGRLSHETFMLRMNIALGARNRGQLSDLFSDLPPRVSRLARARQAVQRWQRGALDAIEESLRSDRPDAGDFDDTPGLSRTPELSRTTPEPDPVPKPLRFPPGPDTSFTIGRDQRCDLYVADMTVSRLHARLAREAGGWRLTDLGSTNGTRLNGWRLRAPVPVRPGDTIMFGSVAFTLQPNGQPDGQPDGQDDDSGYSHGNPRHLEG
jgi:hypothetical protein